MPADKIAAHPTNMKMNDFFLAKMIKGSGKRIPCVSGRSSPVGASEPLKATSGFSGAFMYSGIFLTGILRGFLRLPDRVAREWLPNLAGRHVLRRHEESFAALQ